MQFDMTAEELGAVVYALTMQQTGQATNIANKLREQEKENGDGLTLQAHVVDADDVDRKHALGRTVTVEANGILYVENGDEVIVAAYAAGAWKRIEMREVSDESAADDSAHSA